MSTLMNASGVNPPPEFEQELPLPDPDVYDAFVATADAVTPEDAVDRVYPDRIDLKGLGYEEQTRLKFRLEAGPGRRQTPPSTTHAPADWEGRLTDIGFGVMGARTTVTYEWPGGQNTSWYKPVPNHGTPNGYTLTGLELLAEFYNLDPAFLDKMELELPVPVKQPFNEGVYTVDWTRMRDYFRDLVEWGDADDIYVAHEPWDPSRPRIEAPLKDAYDQRLKGQWVSLNPKYRGRFTPPE